MGCKSYLVKLTTLPSATHMSGLGLSTLPGGVPSRSVLSINGTARGGPSEKVDFGGQFFAQRLQVRLREQIYLVLS